MTELGTLAETGNKLLGSRTLVNVLPPVLLTVIVFVLLASGTPGTPSSAVLVSTLKDFSGAQVALLFLGVVVVAVILQPFQIAVVQILEGYWGGNPLTRSGRRPSIASKASDIGIELQRRRFRLLQMLGRDENDDEYDADDLADDLSELRIKQASWARGQLRGYPERETRLMPTRLGNQLRAAEDDAGGRYGLWTNVVYPRLQSILSDRLASNLASSNDQLDLAAHLCVTLTLATLASVGLLAPNGWRNPWWLLLPAATAAMAYLSYQAAIKAAASQGVLLAAAFDLHRFDLLTALHYRLPEDPWSEYRFNGELSAFLAYARSSTRPDDIRGSNAPEDMLLAVDYEHPAGPAEDGGARRPSGPFQPFRWDWDAILGEAGESGNGAERPDERQPHP